MIISIDGAAATGKSSTAKLLAKKLDYVHLNSGLLYRGFTYIYVKNKLHKLTNKEIKEYYLKNNIQIKGDNLNKVFFNNIDITNKLYDEIITDNIKIISNDIFFRDMITSMQRKLANIRNIVCEGRDIGTVVFPYAEFKFYLTANLRIRIERRHKQYKKNKIFISTNKIKEMITNRDKNDKERKYSPLKKDKDSIVIDTSDLNIEEQVSEILNIIKDRK